MIKYKPDYLTNRVPLWIKKKPNSNLRFTDTNLTITGRNLRPL